ncbi:adenylyl-sulfate kinase [Glutamicibacter arilaitensis]|uniref:Adenylyl-sulfate kinase n=1 Tax=Glutamicibacter arilaitensis (strain DSM 16368 / CIP 108037 / IAM 15318 / JCM 13566 / NCIMB 14258 / Re117) TaxID=861360 RepID=A0ABP1U4E1_GLUAR|nr:adenylyl-sulfate kinase [Glutamicibacter arilaitensis Re117]
MSKTHNFQGLETVLQLDGPALDLLELALGGLADQQDLARWLCAAGYVYPDSANSRRLLLADPDGTALASVEVRPSSTISDNSLDVAQLKPLARSEHGPGRASRLTSALTTQSAVLFSEAPTVSEIHKLSLSTVASQAFLVLVSSSKRASQTDYPNQLRELHDAALLAGAQGAGHLIIPEEADMQQVVQRAVMEVLYDFRKPTDESLVQQGLVVLFSGLSGSGKSTLARSVMERIHLEMNREAVLLDGDDIRRFVSKGLGFSPEDRETNVVRIGWIASRISQVGGIALCAPIAPFAQARAQMRALAEQAGRFVLVHVNTPLEVCEARDRKGLYAKARAGLVKDFTGIDSPYEVPEDASLTLDLSTLSIEAASDQVLELIRSTHH